MSDVVEVTHIVPGLDAVAHTLTDCVCGPSVEDTEDERGRRKVYRHHTLDDRYRYIPIPEGLDG